MHYDMQCDPIQGQGLGHQIFKIENLEFLKAISAAIYDGSWQLTTDSYTREQYLNLIGPDFDIWHSFSVTYGPSVAKSRPSVPYGANLLLLLLLCKYYTTINT